MKRLRIRHLTGYRYEGEATASYNEARMLPASSDGQLVLDARLEISPVTNTHSYTDYWGTRVRSFEILTPHRELSLTATSLIEVRQRTHPPHEADWDDLARTAELDLAYVEQLAQTRRTDPPAEVADLARDLAATAYGPCDAALRICTAIGEAVEYMPGVTGVHTTAAEAWEHRRGVCQDIAHLALGALRSVGIPARYVSGYLHPVPDAEVGRTVAGESHAWVEWFCGEWRGFDPTNLIDIGDRHVRVGHGRDYADVSPLRGVYAGPRSSQLFVTVEITRVS
ncbi:transglutaminase-like putative cysteine protease [Diaminobutyricimonas aerilata]|uniref:Transglutaminase-like putative cysteine protease n=1 Tax=Diaminobutyricimonas aerilata TaxID=1162967 RepID=A0A2M9CFY8_9MICO|nr:transglutaminase family protein [Diaminobutyricimonas aerilata]PJJ70762.1 transglutaminase-like putative cysteine protease [Diaminobutyricimonas aerilata]